jgi:hypothetical protein
MRFLYANRNFDEGLEGWRSDRGRVYILYGPPADVEEYPFVDVALGAGVRWKSAEMWVYDRPAGPIQLPALLRDHGLFFEAFGAPPPIPGHMLFFFARSHDVGILRQIFSTEEGEQIEPMIYDAAFLNP